MKRLWNVINDLDAKKDVKAKMFLFLLVVVHMAAGAALWFILGRAIFPGIEWLICFTGYPAVFAGLLGGIIYLYRHEFA